MKLFVFGFREFDEKVLFDALSEKYKFVYEWSSEHPSLENADKASGCDAVITTVVKIDAPLLDYFKHLGIQYIVTRTVVYDHIDLDYAKKVG